MCNCNTMSYIGGSTYDLNSQLGIAPIVQLHSRIDEDEIDEDLEEDLAEVGKSKKPWSERIKEWAGVGKSVSESAGSFFDIFTGIKKSQTSGTSSTDTETETSTGIPTYVWVIGGVIVVLIGVFVYVKSKK